MMDLLNCHLPSFAVELDSLVIANNVLQPGSEYLANVSYIKIH